MCRAPPRWRPTLYKGNRPMQSTITEYVTLDNAFAFFNAALFDGALPAVVITLQRKAGSYGYFSWDCFRSRDKAGAVTHEIALNPDAFQGRTDKEILGTLVHEMAHLWQQIHGTPSRTNYHNKEWAVKMLEIGLEPVSIDNPGKMTGQKVTHRIMEGDQFDVTCTNFLAAGHALRWQGVGQGAADEDKEKKPSKKNKVKYTCPDCDQNAWAKPGANLICGDCMVAMEAPEAEESED